MPQKFLFYRLRLLAVVALLWAGLGTVLFENGLRTGNDLGLKASVLQVTIAFALLGLIVGAALIFFLRPAFSHQPLWRSTLFKAALLLLLFLMLSFALLSLSHVLSGNGGLNNYLQTFFNRIVHAHSFWMLMLDLGLLSLLSIMYLEVSDKYGPGMFGKMLVGKYHQPKREERIFIFMDINESTSIAEHLGHEQYFHLLRRFYRDITRSVIANDGEIYQYVGDEVVMTWPHTAENKLKSLKFLRNSYFLIERLAPQYQRRYGHVPRFKAGVHAGEVTAGFIGVIKKDLVYSGDTLNTAARLRSYCHEAGERFLLSEQFMQDLHLPAGYSAQPAGVVQLRGHNHNTAVFALKFESNG